MNELELNAKLYAIILGTPGERGLGVPTICWGPPGIAKTTSVETAARALNRRLVVLTPQHDEAQYGLVPVYDSSAGLIRTPPHEWVDQLCAEGGILALDDVTSQRSATHAAQLRLLTHREIGNRKLPSNVAIVAFANPVAEAADGRALSAATANRFMHVLVATKWTAAAQFLLGNKETMAELPRLIRKIDAEFDTAFALESSTMAGFLAVRGDAALNAADTRDDIDCTIQATPRSSVMATRAVAAARIVDAPQLVPAIISGLMGRSHAAAYVEYASRVKVPQVSDVIEGRWSPSKGQADIVFLVLSRLAASVEKSEGDAKKAAIAAFWRVCREAETCHVPNDIMVLPAKKVAKLGFMPPHGTVSRALAEVML